MTCPCHARIDDAVAAHQHLVTRIAATLSNPHSPDWDDLVSDGNLALWRALERHDPTRNSDLDSYLCHSIRFRQIDGLRSRSGRGYRPAIGPLTDDHNTVPVASAWDDLLAAIDASAVARELLRTAAQIDPRLPGILARLATGDTQREIATDLQTSRTSIWRMRTQLLHHTRTSA